MSEMITVGEAIARTLEQYHVEAIYGVISIHNLPIADAVAACARFAANGAEALEDGHLSHVKLASLSNDAFALGPIINSIAGSGSALR